MAKKSDYGVNADAEPNIAVRRRKLTDYQHDPQNPNKGSDRGRAIIRESLTKRGAGRSLLASADDNLIAGNQTMDEALQAGITDVIEIETDGSALVVVKRTDVNADDERARQLAYDDNRSRDHAEWVLSVIESDWENGIDMTDYFDADEMEALLEQVAAESQVDAAMSGGGTGRDINSDKARQIKAVLYAPQVLIFEQALRATGLENRGEALMEVCTRYLESAGNEAAVGQKAG